MHILKLEAKTVNLMGTGRLGVIWSFGKKIVFSCRLRSARMRSTQLVSPCCVFCVIVVCVTILFATLQERTAWTDPMSLVILVIDWLGLLFLHKFIYFRNFHFLVIFHFLLKHVRLYRLYFIIPMKLAQAGSIFVFGRCLSVYEENINRFYRKSMYKLRFILTYKIATLSLAQLYR